ncbi:MAG: energy coupling factor transporter S component ThiW [Fastidiosipilaceae bacterium]|jgi:energy coupling factor transporter S component ThiW|nr:energy coupling factor transporter S component ThiW [Clostridiaceae bacterium]
MNNKPTERQQSRRKLLRLITASILIAGCYILSPILRVPGMAPVQHLFNVTGAVLLGPAYNFINAVIVSSMRMATMGISPLAFTGSIFGALLSGWAYRYTGSILAATIGEIIGTGVIGSIASYPVMTLLAGESGLNWFYYTPSFIMGTLIGGLTALIVLSALKRTGQLQKFQAKLGTKFTTRKLFNKK